MTRYSLSISFLLLLFHNKVLSLKSLSIITAIRRHVTIINLSQKNSHVLINITDISHISRTLSEIFSFANDNDNKLKLEKKGKGENHDSGNLHFLSPSFVSQVDRDITNRDFTYQTMLSSSRRACTQKVGRLPSSPTLYFPSLPAIYFSHGFT